MSDYLNKLLIKICSKLQLPENKYELATERYETIAKTIQGDEVFKGISLSIYPHGSFRQKTTVKPLDGEEYDLDFVAQIQAETSTSMMPGEFYNHIYRILSNDGIHNTMLEKKSRCIRVNYANDFHMDIMPGKQISPESNEIIVPDKELTQWYHHSNPIDYADWFEKQARDAIIRSIYIESSKYGNAEEIEEQEIVSRLEPLRRAVQLIKRYRDMYCDKNDSAPVRSIIISTLMGQISSKYSDELSIIKDFCDYIIALDESSNDQPFVVKNPVVDEVLSEKWQEDARNYLDFIAMVKELRDDVNQLKQSKYNSDINKKLKEMFGETITNYALKEYVDDISKQRVKENLSVDSSGIVNADGRGNEIGKNTFYGEE